MPVANDSADLFRHVSAEKAAFYRCIMDVFAAAKRQYRLQLRPDEVLAEARWPDGPPRIEEVQCGAEPARGLGQPRIAAGYCAGLQPQRLLPRPLSLSAVAGRRGGGIGAGGVRADPAASRRTADGGARRHCEPAAGAGGAGRRGGDPTWPRCTRRCAIWCASSRAWPRTRRPSWPAWRAASSCSRPRPARSRATSAG